MAASDISICIPHLDKRGWRYDGWKDNNPETCCVCVTGFYPSWEMKSEWPFDMLALEHHVERMLASTPE